MALWDHEQRTPLWWLCSSPSCPRSLRASLRTERSDATNGAPGLTRSKMLLVTSASLLVTSALLVVTRSYVWGSWPYYERSKMLRTSNKGKRCMRWSLNKPISSDAQGGHAVPGVNKGQQPSTQAPRACVFGCKPCTKTNSKLKFTHKTL